MSKMWKSILAPQEGEIMPRIIRSGNPPLMVPDDIESAIERARRRKKNKKKAEKIKRKLKRKARMLKIKR
jgi:hypothetical protein